MFVLCIQGSPRKDGNTAMLMSEFMDEAITLGAETQLIEISEKKISPCIECNTCEIKGYCPIDDDMREVYYLLTMADLVILGTPMFFYAPPAQLKALIDRAQMLWARKYVFDLFDPGRLWRRGFMIALGATKGKNLFEGANLISKYFFDAIGAEYIGYLGYRKIEKKGDILKHPKAISEIREKAEELIGPFMNRKKVLFVCKENACRSQMAYAFARTYFGNKIDVRSAGSHPAGKINLLMVDIMAEKGIDVSCLRPNSLDRVLFNWNPDIVISLGCEEKCPNIQGVSYQEWDIPDPADKPIAFMRDIRDKLEVKIKEFFTNF